VVERLEKPTSRHGRALFTVLCCRVGERERAFLKALDYVEALDSPEPARALEAMTQAYNFERDLLGKCRDFRMDHVVRAISSGTMRIDGAPAGSVVEYLILDLADHDVRVHLAQLEGIEVAWILRCLHHISTGLKQLHTDGIAHQDVTVYRSRGTIRDGERGEEERARRRKDAGESRAGQTVPNRRRRARNVRPRRAGVPLQRRRRASGRKAPESQERRVLLFAP
jgi:hypothetical protein